jgi:HAD superfamily hydrolase (TIGR01549 family)
VGRYQAVLLDWRGVVALDPEPSWWVRRALASLGRHIDPEVVDAAVAGIAAAGSLPEILEAERHEDCSPELNRSVSMLRFEKAGLDAELAEALYQLDFEPESHPLYPDVPDVLAAIQALEVKIALVSDIHFDLRADLAKHGVTDLFDAYVLSFEHGFQKPDPRMFQLALDAVGVDALMVGDRVSHDGGAVSVGITTLILPGSTSWCPAGSTSCFAFSSRSTRMAHVLATTPDVAGSVRTSPGSADLSSDLGQTSQVRCARPRGDSDLRNEQSCVDGTSVTPFCAGRRFIHGIPRAIESLVDVRHRVSRSGGGEHLDVLRDGSAAETNVVSAKRSQVPS